MALFKINRGNSTTLPEIKTDGWAYFCTDTSMFYIDFEDEEGVLQRRAINAEDAETIMGASLATILNDTDFEFPTSKAILDALINKVDKVDGKGLSTNDYTNEDKERVNRIPEDTENGELIAFVEYTEEKIQALWDSVIV